MIEIACVPVVTSFDEHCMCFLVELIHSTMGEIGKYSIILGRDGELRDISGYHKPGNGFNYYEHKESIIETCRKASKAIWES